MEPLTPIPTFAQPDRQGLWKRCVRACYLLVSLASLFCCAWVRAQDGTPSEYQVKAAFLVNFSKYVEWPENAFTNETAPLVIGICGEGRIREDLKKMVIGKTINKRPYIVKYFADGQEPGPECHILFIRGSEKRRSADIINRLRSSPVLIVGETDSFLQQGGIINFALKDRKVRLQVSLEAADKAGLKISSKLLSLAEVVKVKPPEK